MKYRILGRTGIRVSRLCFGVLTIGPLQSNLPLAEGASLLRYAASKGVNFFDTAEIYHTYPYLKELIKTETDLPPVITSKCYAVTAEEARESLERARRELDRDYIDIFMLHEQESALTLAGHRAALEYFYEARERGLIRAVGISTHRVAGVRGAAEIPEIDVVFPLFNRRGLGIQDGSIAEMAEACRKAEARGKGIYLMKALGGGHLLSQTEEALRFALAQPFAASVAVGMKNRNEVDYNIRVAGGEEIPDRLRELVSHQQRRLHIESWCEGCGRCAQVCPQEALRPGGDGKMTVDEEKCLLCGYCAGACPNFFIKVY